MGALFQEDGLSMALRRVPVFKNIFRRKGLFSLAKDWQGVVDVRLFVSQIGQSRTLQSAPARCSASTHEYEAQSAP